MRHCEDEDDALIKAARAEVAAFEAAHATAVSEAAAATETASSMVAQLQGELTAARDEAAASEAARAAPVAEAEAATRHGEDEDDARIEAASTEAAASEAAHATAVAEAAAAIETADSAVAQFRVESPPRLSRRPWQPKRERSP